MKVYITGLLCVLLLMSSHSAHAQDSVAMKSRPKVGVVLSGGGAKGAAHIGVLKYIEEAGIPVDYIAGTSMGAIVGGMYALGYSSDEILNIISSVDWDRLISNNVDRREISYDAKRKSRTNLLTIPFSFGTNTEELQARSFKNSLPSGLVSGDNIINLFNSLSVGYSDPVDFSELPIPFICIATNMRNGEADVLNKGVISKALRASMAIPILFDPIEIDHTLYADGGLVNNFPAEQCRAMGADYVIGVSMSPGLEDEIDNLSSIISQVKQLKEIITDKEYDNYHNLCDIFISPDLKGVGMLSFDAESVARITQSGYEAAATREADFKALREEIFTNPCIQPRILLSYSTGRNPGLHPPRCNTDG
ncbi:MAG: patatin-like phospholipase family protein, partial [Rikenellaceae bacterium]|nr:patatin-like phospholipase family protein [Rikenellaceae bacterium]